MSDAQKNTIKDIAHDLKVIKSKVPFIEDVIVRAGFVADLLFDIEPHDIDVYYTTKEQIGEKFSNCRCDEIRELTKDLDFKIMNKKYEIDFGHSGEGELYVPAIEKMTGFFSHLWEVAIMLCIDTDGNLWSN